MNTQDTPIQADVMTHAVNCACGGRPVLMHRQGRPSHLIPSRDWYRVVCSEASCSLAMGRHRPSPLAAMRAWNNVQFARRTDAAHSNLCRSEVA